MRIISGKYKKKQIKTPKNLNLRPTTDIAKEGLFNVLNNNFDLENIKVLDLFSGTGNISYEFASRGCEDITSIELNYRNFNFIKKTVSDLSLSEIKPVKTNAFVYLKHCKEQYDIIFADPPYDLKDISKIAEMVIKNCILKPDGWLIIEHSKNTNLKNIDLFAEQREYGSVNFSFFHK